MSSQQNIKLLGKVIESLPNSTFRVELANGHEVTARLSGKIKMHNIKVIPGDIVDVEISPYDMEKGRITFRYRERSIEDVQQKQDNSSSSSTS